MTYEYYSQETGLVYITSVDKGLKFTNEYGDTFELKQYGQTDYHMLETHVVSYYYHSDGGEITRNVKRNQLGEVLWLTMIWKVSPLKKRLNHVKTTTMILPTKGMQTLTAVRKSYTARNVGGVKR